jgi:hypothetical protein
MFFDNNGKEWGGRMICFSQIHGFVHLLFVLIHITKRKGDRQGSIDSGAWRHNVQLPFWGLRFIIMTAVTAIPRDFVTVGG